MRKLIPFLAVVMAVSLVFLVSGCNNRTDRSESGTTMSDSDMEKLVEGRFSADPQLSAADLNVTADQDSRELKLSGTVSSEDARSKAVQIAKSAMPGYTVTDTIDVKPREMARTDEEGNEGQMNEGRRNLNDPFDRNETQRDRTQPAR